MKHIRYLCASLALMSSVYLPSATASVSFRKLWNQYAINNTAEIINVAELKKSRDLMDAFNKLTRRMSLIAKSHNMKLNIGIVGACDGDQVCHVLFTYQIKCLV